MLRRSNRVVLAGAAVMLAAVVSAGADSYAHPRPEKPEASPPTAAGKNKPTVAYWHVWTDEKGVSH